MTRKDLAELMFPNVTLTKEDYEKKYPPRDLPEGAIVTRCAPSPTGLLHMGNLRSFVIAEKVAKDTNGVFYLRIEDTDGKRTIENGIQKIIDAIHNFDIQIDEGVISQDEQKGSYGPYIQTQRKEIYDAYAKYMIENDLAYPCFCNEEEIEDTRKNQEGRKERIGYYGKYAHCRHMSIDEAYEKIKNGAKYVIRIKSQGDYDKRIVIDDLVKGKVVFPENDIDHVLIKSDGIPVYHFAHLVDDHLMRTTHILRGEEWLSSTPLHLELFKMFGYKPPKYAHLGLVLKVDEDGSKRKLSKRKDPEASLSYYHEKGIPVTAVKLYLMTIANTNFEEWMDHNPDKTMDDFKFSFKKMSASGSLFDLEKLLNISKNYISKLTKEEVYNYALTWAQEFDPDFAKLLQNYKDYSMSIFNIEREQKKPRKDYASFSEIKNQIWYMYDELFVGELDYNFAKINDANEIEKILNTYINEYYDENDDKDTWFNKIKLLTDSLGYCSNMKEYKQNPNNYKGNVADISTVIRVALTTSTMTPDLYEISKLLGKDRLRARFTKAINTIKK